jgi:hypothetical protein
LVWVLKACWLAAETTMMDMSDKPDKWSDSPLAWGIAGWLAGGLHKGLLVGGLACLLQRKRQQQERQPMPPIPPKKPGPLKQ